MCIRDRPASAISENLRLSGNRVHCPLLILCGSVFLAPDREEINGGHRVPGTDAAKETDPHRFRDLVQELIRNFSVQAVQAAQKPFRRLLCKYLNLRGHRISVRPARKQMFLGNRYGVDFLASYSDLLKCPVSTTSPATGGKENYRHAARYNAGKWITLGCSFQIIISE